MRASQRSTLKAVKRKHDAIEVAAYAEFAAPGGGTSNGSSSVGSGAVAVGGKRPRHAASVAELEAEIKKEADAIAFLEGLQARHLSQEQRSKANAKAMLQLFSTMKEDIKEYEGFSSR